MGEGARGVEVETEYDDAMESLRRGARLGAGALGSDILGAFQAGIGPWCSLRAVGAHLRGIGCE